MQVCSWLSHTSTIHSVPSIEEDTQYVSTSSPFSRAPLAFYLALSQSKHDVKNCFHVLHATKDFLGRKDFIFGQMPVLSFFIKQMESSNQNLNCFVQPICDFESDLKLTKVNGSLFTEFYGIQTVPWGGKLLNTQHTSLLQATEHLHSRSPSLVRARCEDMRDVSGTHSSLQTSLVNGNSLSLKFQRH